MKMPPAIENDKNASDNQDVYMADQDNDVSIQSLTDSLAETDLNCVDSSDGDDGPPDDSCAECPADHGGACNDDAGFSRKGKATRSKSQSRRSLQALLARHLAPLAMIPGAGLPGYLPREQLSNNNIYIRGLRPETSDEDIHNLCQQFGPIISAKSIIDHDTQLCKGYGFVMFESPISALNALNTLTALGIQATFAKLSYNERVVNQHLPEEDPTNLYFSGLPHSMTEMQLQALLRPFGEVVSCRVLKDKSGMSRGVGFARMHTREICERVISDMNGKTIEGSDEPIHCKFADNPTRRAKGSQRGFSKNALGHDDLFCQMPFLLQAGGGMLPQMYAPPLVPLGQIPVPQTMMSGMSSANNSRGYAGVLPVQYPNAYQDPMFMAQYVNLMPIPTTMYAPSMVMPEMLSTAYEAK